MSGTRLSDNTAAFCEQRCKIIVSRLLQGHRIAVQLTLTFRYLVENHLIGNDSAVVVNEAGIGMMGG